jgi:hypothetical protein
MKGLGRNIYIQKFYTAEQNWILFGHNQKGEGPRRTAAGKNSLAITFVCDDFPLLRYFFLVEHTYAAPVHPPSSGARGTTT